MRVITHGWEALKPMAWMMKYAPMAHIHSPEEFLSIDNRPEGSPVSLSPAQNQRALSQSLGKSACSVLVIAITAQHEDVDKRP